MISIILLAHNAPKIVDPLGEILERVSHEFELIVVNDGSNDDHVRKLREYAKNDSRLVVIDRESRKIDDTDVSQHTHQTHTAIRIAKYQRVIFIPDEEIVEPDWLEETLQKAAEEAQQKAKDDIPKTFTQKVIKRYGAWVQKLSSAVMDQALFAGSNFVLNVLLARWMPPEYYGAFVVAYSWFLLPQNLYESILIEPMSIFGSGKYNNRFRGYLGYVFYGHFFLAVFIAFVLTLGAIAVTALDSQILGSAIAGSAVAAPFFLTRWLTRRPFYVLSKPQWSAFGGALYFVFGLIGIIGLRQLDLAIQPIVVCPPDALTYSCFSLTNTYLTPFNALVVMGISGFIASIILTVFLLRPKLQLANNDGITVPGVLKDHWTYGRWSIATRIMTWLPQNIYYIVIPVVLTLGESGALRAMMNLVQPVHMSLIAITAVLLPTYVRTFNRKGKEGLNGRVRNVLYGSLLFTSAYLVAVVVFGPWAMTALYDGAYDDAINMPILIAMGALPLLTGMRVGIDAALRAMGGVKFAFQSKILPTIFTMTGGLWLLANYGILGVHIGSLIEATISVMTLYWFYRNKDGTEDGMHNVSDDDDSTPAKAPTNSPDANVDLEKVSEKATI